MRTKILENRFEMVQRGKVPSSRPDGIGTMWTDS